MLRLAKMASLRLSSLLAFVLVGVRALDIPTEITLCDRSYTYVRPTPAERNSTSGFEWHLSYFGDPTYPNLVSRYFAWPPIDTFYGSGNSVYVYTNTTYDPVLNKTVSRGDPSYVVPFSLKPFWNNTWLNLPTADYPASAFVTVTLVANVSQTITSSIYSGDVSLVNYLEDASGEPVRATRQRSIYCDQYINPDGSAKDRSQRDSDGSSGGHTKIWAIGAPILIVGGIILILALKCCCCGRRQSIYEGERRMPAFCRRHWQKRQRRRAAEGMTEPAFVDDTEKTAATANWSGAPTYASATQPIASQAVRFDLPIVPPTATVSHLPLATINEDRIVVHSIPAGDAMDGVAGPPPAYFAPPSYPSTHA